MPATLEVDLESLAPPGNPDDFIRLDPRPVFKEHWSREIEGDDGEVLESKYIGQEQLSRIADRCNERILDTADWCPIVINHTDDEGKTDPEVVGFIGPFRTGIYGNLKPKHSIFATPWIFKECYEKAKKYPRLSVEFWAKASDPTDGYFDPCSLLGATTPELDLGVHYSKDDTGLRLVRYAKVTRFQATPTAPGGSNTSIPAGTNIDRRKKQTFEKDETSMAQGTLTPGDLQQIVDAIIPVVQSEVTKQMGAGKADPSEPLNPGDDFAGEDIDGDGIDDSLDGDLTDGPDGLPDDDIDDGLGDDADGLGDDLGDDLDGDGFGDDDDGDGIDDALDDNDGDDDFAADDADDEPGDAEIDDSLDADGTSADAGDAGDSDDSSPPGDGPSADNDPPPDEGKKKMSKTPYAKLCEFEEAGDEAGARKFFAALDDAGKKAMTDEMDGDSDADRVGRVQKYMATPTRTTGDEKFTRQQYAKVVKERDEMRSRYQKEVAARRELQTKHDLLAERIEKSEAEGRRAVRYQKLSELPTQGYILDIDEEIERVKDFTEDQFAGHLDLIVNRYQRAPIGSFLPTAKPQRVTGKTTDEKRERYAKQARDNVTEARAKGQKMEFKDEYERLLAADVETAA